MQAGYWQQGNYGVADSNQGATAPKTSPTQPYITVVTPPVWYLRRRVINGYPDIEHPVALQGVTVGSYEFYFVPAWWVLSEGVQTLTREHAIGMGAIALGSPVIWYGSNGFYKKAPLTVDTIGYLFAYDPSPYIPTGLESGAYQPGKNVGLETWHGVILGVSVIGGIAGGAILAGAAEGSIAAGAAESSSAAAAGASTGASAGIDLSADIPAFTAAQTATVAEGGISQAGILGAGVTTEAFDAVGISAGEYSLSQGGILASAGNVGAQLGTKFTAAAIAAGMGKAIQAIMPKKSAPASKSGYVPAVYVERATEDSSTKLIVTSVVAGLIILLIARFI